MALPMTTALEIVMHHLAPLRPGSLRRYWDVAAVGHRSWLCISAARSGAVGDLQLWVLYVLDARMRPALNLRTGMRERKLCGDVW